MPQLRRIQDVSGQWWSVPPPPYCMVMPVSEPETSAMVLFRDGLPGVLVEDRARAEYILTMRDPRKHCDPLPEFIEQPTDLPYPRSSGQHDDWATGAENRRAGRSHASFPPSKSEGWEAQQAIAIAFYREHVIGREP